jgi:serine/threonine protein kinase
LIGTTDLGKRYRGFQSSIGREASVLIIEGSVTGEPHLIRRFESEMQTFSRLEHPHLAPVFDFWREPDRAFVVTPFYRGGALEPALVDRSWGLSATVKLADQLADALLSPSTG